LIQSKFLTQIQMINNLYLDKLYNLNKNKYNKLFKEVFKQTISEFEKALKKSTYKWDVYFISKKISDLIKYNFKSDKKIYKEIEENLNNIEILKQLLEELFFNNIYIADTIEVKNNSLKHFLALTPDDKWIIDENSFSLINENLISSIISMLQNKDILENYVDNLMIGNGYDDANRIALILKVKESFKFDSIPKFKKYKKILDLQEYPITVMLGDSFITNKLIFQEDENSIYQFNISNELLDTLIEMYDNSELIFKDNKFFIRDKSLVEVFNAIG